MRLLSLACVPFFFVPVDHPRVAQMLDVSPPRPVAVRAAPPTTEPKHSTPTGHRAPPSGCHASLPAPHASRSVGSPTRGELQGGQFLDESEVVHHVDAADCNFWGTDELVGALRRVAKTVASAHPHHRLTVGELSQPKGGDISGHASHENGRDVDLGFYFLDEEGQPYEPGRFVDVRRDRSARVGDRTLTFDVARNWKLVEALLGDGDADVHFILVNGRIRDWLLAHARSLGVAGERYRQASRVLVRPRRGRHPHRNHFHVRIYCPETAAGCRDRGRLWEWVESDREERSADVPSEAFASLDPLSAPPEIRRAER